MNKKRNSIIGFTLIGLGVLCYFLCSYLSSSNRESQYKSRDLQLINQQLGQYQSDFQDIVTQIENDKQLQFSDFTSYYKKDYTVLYFTDKKLKFWSNRQFIPQSITDELTSSNSFLLPYDDVVSLIDIVELDSENHLVFMLPLTDNSNTQNIKRLRYEYEISPVINKDSGETIIYDGKAIGQMNTLPEARVQSFRLLTILWILFIVFSIVGVVILTLNIDKSKLHILKIIIPFAAFWLISFLIRKDSFFIFSDFQLFNPGLYGHQYLGNSLGNLVFNILFVALLTIIWYRSPLIINSIKLELPSWLRKMLFIINIVGVTSLLLYLYRSLILDSSVEIRFFLSSNYFSYWLVLVMVTAGFVLFIASYRLLKEYIISLNRVEIAIVFLLTVVLALPIFLSLFGKHGIFYTIWLCGFIAAFHFILDENGRINQMSQIFAIISLASVLTTYALTVYNKEKDVSQLQQLARQITLGQEYLPEKFSLQIEAEEIQKNRSIQDMLNLPFISNNTIARRIERTYFNDIDLRKYERNATIIIGKEALDTYENLTDIQVEDVNTQFDKISYRVKIPFFIGETLSSVILVELTKNKIAVADSFYERYNGNRGQSAENPFSNSLSYSIIEDGLLKFLQGKSIDYDIDEFKEMQIGTLKKVKRFKGNSYVYKFSEASYIVLRLEKKLKNRVLIFFSFIFVNIVLAYIIFALFSLRFRISNSGFFRRYISNRIQFFVISIIYAAAIIIVAISITSMRGEIVNSKKETYSNIVDDIYNKYSLVNQSTDTDDIHTDFRQFLNERYKNSEYDLHFFNQDGKLSFTNNNRLFADKIWPETVHPVAFETLQQKKVNAYQQLENVISQDYFGTYLALRGNRLDLAGILYLPAFDIKQSINNQKVLFDNSLLSTFSVVLALITFITLFITNSFTNFLQNIRAKVAQVDIGDHQVIEWQNKEDEIGLLIGEYNDMVVKLDESAVVLARGERENTWREVAKQVAHEIKNPLTPMQLSIQHLKRTIPGDTDRNTPMIKTLETLITQIDHLTKMADNFSSVAQMDLPEMQIVNLNDVLVSIYDMFAIGRANITYEKRNETGRTENLVYADKTMLNRVFTNLVKNAEQAIGEKPNGQITISLEETNNLYNIRVIDNGKGITTENRAKIFTPNFTTKKSGTGIGLMMSKKIVDMHNGNISFASTPGLQTTFTVTLPKYHKINA